MRLVRPEPCPVASPQGSSTQCRAAAAMAIAYWLLGVTASSYSISFGSVTSAIFLPEGLALFMVLWFGPRVAVGVFVGQLLLAGQVGLPLLVALQQAAGNAFTCWLGWAILRQAKFDLGITTLRDYVVFVVTAAVVLQPISAVVGVHALLQAGLIPEGGLWQTALYWWLGNFIAQLTLTPLLLVTAQRISSGGNRREYLKIGAITLLSAGSFYIVLRLLNLSEAVQPLLAYALIFPCAIILTLRYQFLGASISGASFTYVAQIMTVKGLGPFALGNANAELLYLNTFVIGIVIATGLVGIILREKQQIHSALEYQVSHDSLTGLHNRRHFIDSAELALERLNRSGQTLSLLMLDLDCFKQINDRYGHAVGDEVLRKFSQMLRRELRVVDLSARIGGEEFAIVLEGASDPQSLAARLCREARSLNVTAAGEPVRTSVSIGIATSDDAGVHDLTDLMRLADRRLYRAKRSGRNRVESTATFGSDNRTPDRYLELA